MMMFKTLIFQEQDALAVYTDTQEKDEVCVIHSFAQQVPTTFMQDDLTGKCDEHEGNLEVIVIKFLS